MNRVTIREAAGLLRGAEEILIITHIRPDGDTAGAGCALCLGLRSLGKTAYLAENPPSMDRYERYMVPLFAPVGYVPRYIAAVDIAGPGQYPPGCELLAENTDLAIDHHGTNTGYARATLLDDHAAAAGELVYLTLRVLRAAITPEIAEALYVSLLTDTDGFRTAGTTGRTLRIAGRLREENFDAFALTRRLLVTRSAARLRLESALFGGMRFPREGVCVMTLPYETILDCGAGEDDMDKLSVLTMAPAGVRAGVLLRQLPGGEWKLSLRTDGSLHAGRIMRLVGGGGHPDAAGGVAAGDSDAIEAEILRAIQDVENQIYIKEEQKHETTDNHFPGADAAAESGPNDSGGGRELPGSAGRRGV